jgi:HPt (histidine-containing phosphotransfer) domain-containing protein
MDLGELAENLGLEDEEYIELIDLFIETAISDLHNLLSAVEDKDPEKASSAAHSIKGAAGNLGLAEIYKRAGEIEAEARNGSVDGLGKPLQALKKDLDAVAELVRG